MKRETAILAWMLLLAGSQVTLAQSADVTGEWEITINSPQGALNVKASLKQSGEQVSGFIKVPGGDLPFEGTIVGKQLKVSYKVPFQGNEFALKITG